MTFFYPNENVFSQKSYTEILAYTKENEFKEDFSNKFNNWLEFDHPSKIELDIIDGNLNIENNSNFSYYFLKKEFNIDYEKDFQIETNFKFQSDLTNDYSILWGGENDNNSNKFYEFTISKEGYFKISKYNEKWYDYALWIKSDFITKGFNKLTIRKVSNLYFFFINENFVYSQKLDEVFGKKIGFQTNPYSILKVDNLELSNLNEGVSDDFNIYALVIGISRYKTVQNSLMYCVDDSQKFADYLRSPEGGGVKEENLKVLNDFEATTSNILNEAKRLFGKAKKNDYVIFYFSGHGGPNFFLSYDNFVEHKELKEIIYNCKDSRKLCIADACYSGTWDKTITLSTINQNLKDKDIKRLYNEVYSNSSNSLALLMSCASDEKSIIDTINHQGLFTYYLLKGLSGEADADEKNHIITLLELYDYVRDNVYVRARDVFQHKQKPRLKGACNTEMLIGITRN